jgi:hypothetical protein
MADDPKTERFGVRADAKGWTVFEVWTGQPVMLAMDRQIGLSEADALHPAELMNRRVMGGDPALRP